MSHAQTAVLELQGVGLTYRGRRSLFRHSYIEALGDITFQLYRGETLGIIGGNGSGKSTLLKVMAGIFRPNQGSLLNHGATVALQSIALGQDPELNGWDNALISAMLMGFDRRTARASLPHIAEFAELGRFMDEPVKTYSNGMRARLGFAVAIIMQPDVLLIDEVLGVGDSRFREKAEAAMLDKMHSGQTAVLVSHSPEQIRNTCERVIWLDNGAIKKLGSADEVLDDYKKWVSSPGNLAPAPA